MRRYAFIPFALTGAIACSSNDSSVPPLADAGADAPPSGSRNDGSVEGEGGSADASSADASSADASSADAGPPEADAAGDGMITSSLGSTGDIDIYNDLVTASFYEDDTILRSDDAPDCVVHLRSATKPLSPAGTVTIGGAIVGSDGGTASIIQIGPPDAGANQYLYFGPVFPAMDDLLLQVEASATVTFPAMGVQSLPLPPANPLVLTQPAFPDSGDLAIPSTQAFTVAWTVPSGVEPDAEPGLQVGLRLLDFGDGSKLASLYCSFPLSAGAGQVPADLLSEIRNEVGANACGNVQIFVGSQIEFTSMGASYIVAVLLDPAEFPTLSYQIQGELQ